MRAYLVFTGTELLLGQIVNTNARFLGEKLAAQGIDLYSAMTVGDNLERIAAAVRQGTREADLIIVVGGLGPTEDDLSREALAHALGETLVHRPEAWDVVAKYFRRRQRPIPEVNRKQALAPAGARILDNSSGTAPGIYYEKEGKIYVLLPGPPRELQLMYEHALEPLLEKIGGGMVIISRVLKLCGIGEPAAEEKIRDLVRQSNPTVALTVKAGEIHLRITSKEANREKAHEAIAPVEKEIRRRLGQYVFGVDTDSLEAVVGKLLLEKGLTVAVAESCTGGLLAHRLTNMPGSSGYFHLGTVVYHNRWKEQLLQLPAELLETRGAVSRETAEAMARGIRRLAGTDLGLGITGIAGPGGATPEKPVGLIYLAVDYQGSLQVRKELFTGSREDIKWRSSQAALYLLYRLLKEEDEDRLLRQENNETIRPGQ